MEASALEPPAPAGGSVRARVTRLRRSWADPAVGLALATVVQQLTSVVFTVVFTRVLGTAGYGALSALVGATVILLVPGSALQVAAGRHGALGRLGRDGGLAATLDRLTRHLLLGLAGVAVVATLARQPLSALVGVEQAWAAAAAPVCGALWLLVSVQRGLLGGLRAYRPVAWSLVLEGVGRTAAGLLLVAAGLGVTGAFLGLLVGLAAVAAALHRSLRARLGPATRIAARRPLRGLARDALVPTAALALVAVLQNVDVVAARHVLDAGTAGVYAAATVAAKPVVWVAVGVSLWVLPEATRRAAAGRDPRPVLVRGLLVVGAVALPGLVAFAAVPSTVLGLAFGAGYRSGDAVLLPLGLGFALLACTLVAVQFQLGLHRRRFVGLLLAVAVAEAPLLLSAGTLEGFATRLVVVQGVAALAAVGLAARRDRPSAAPPGGVEPAAARGGTPA